MCFHAERYLRAAWVLVSVLGAVGCEQTSGFDFMTGPLMRPGDNCLRCHRSERSDYPTAPAWTAAGTVFPGPDSPTTDGVPDVNVLLLDGAGTLIETLVTNAAGNFYTQTAVPQGFRVALEYEGERIDMPCAPPTGGCAACHSEPAIGGAPGRLFIPQAPEAGNIAAECGGF